MIKRITVGRKNPSLSHEEWKKYYLGTHAPLFLKNAAPYIRKYIINFAVDIPGTQNPFDYATELYFEDLDTWNLVRNSEPFQKIILPDESKLGNVDRQSAWFEELVQKDIPR